MGIESIATDPVNPNRVYMATGMYAQSWAGPGAFMRSDDQGNTWHITKMTTSKMGGNDLGRSNGERLAIDPHQPKILFLWFTPQRHVEEHERIGELEQARNLPGWQRSQGPWASRSSCSTRPLAKSASPRKVIYAGVSRTDENLYRNADAGQTWQLVPKQPKGFLPARAAVDRDGTLYVAYGNDPGPYAVQDGALFRYEPKGDVWTDITPLKPSDTDKFGYGASRSTQRTQAPS